MSDNKFRTEPVIGRGVTATYDERELVIDDMLEKFDMDPMYPRGVVRIESSDVNREKTHAIELREDTFESIIKWYCGRDDTDLEVMTNE